MAGSVSFSVTLAGTPLAPALLDAIQEVQVEDHADLADVARLKLSAAVSPAGPQQSWTVLDEPICARLANLRIGVRLGGDSVTPLIDSYVIDVRAMLSAEPGQSVVEIVAMDATVLMDLEEKVRAWPDQSDSSIAQAIFGDYGFDADVQPADPVRQQDEVTTTQRGSDIRFLRKLAERNGCECYLDVGDDGRTSGHFHPPRLEQPPQAVLSVNLGTETNVDDFKARYDMLAATTAAVTGLDASDASDQAAQAPETSQRTLGAQSAVAGDRPRVKLLSQTGLAKAGELQTLAQAVVDRSAYAITAEGKVNSAALPQILKAKQPVNVRGAGGQFSGQYYVQRVLHHFTGAAYEQRVTLKRNAAGLTRRESFKEDDAVAPQPAVVV
jgi:phage protein D